jgi:hypothetical protein
MSNFLQKDCNVLDMHSQWVGDSLIRTVVRHFGKRNKVMIDVTEFAPRHTSKQRAVRVARDAARRVGCTSVDCVNVSDIEIVRSSRNIHTDGPTNTKVRTMTFAFDGIAR